VARVHRLGAARQLAARALASGGIQDSPSAIRWDISASCESPVLVPFEGRPDTRRGEAGMPVEIVMETRCRRCRQCLRYRAWLWRNRALAEIASCHRTWFGTITLRPEEHYLAELRSSAHLARRGVTLQSLSQEERFAERHRAISRDLTNWLKRIRKVSGAKLRFCLVAEAHKSGLPHYHILVHECSIEHPVTKRQLQDSWRAGFTQFKLVDDPRAAFYVTKYLSKSILARVRASLHYGKNALSIAARENSVKIRPTNSIL